MNFGKPETNQQAPDKIGRRLAVTAFLLMVPAAVLLYHYVETLNKEVDRTEEALAAIEWSSRLNQIRLDALSDDTDVRYRFDETEAVLENLADDLIEAGIASEEDRPKLNSTLEYAKKDGEKRDLRWRRKILNDLYFAGDRIRRKMGYSISSSMELDQASQLLFSMVPQCALELYKVNSWIFDTLEQDDSERARSSIQVRTVALVRLRLMGEEMGRILKDVESYMVDSSALHAQRVGIKERFKIYEDEARRLLAIKENISVLDILGQIADSNIPDADSEALWNMGKSIALDIVKVSEILEPALAEIVLAHRETVMHNRNRNMAIVVCLAILALLMGYYVVKNMVLVQNALSNQNKVLESKIQERVAEIEEARTLALEAKAIAEKERNHAIELNTVLREQTDISNHLAQKAVAAEKAKSQFLANMSHEIRTPMNGVIGMTHMLRDSGLNETQLDHIETLEQSSEALLALIDDVLDLSKIEAGKLRIEETEGDLSEVISSTAALFAPGAHQKSLELLSFHPVLLNRKLVFDAYRLRQVFSNLLSNAIKFTQTGFVRFDADVESEKGDEVRIKFTVQDTGIGISLENQASLFNAFAQADESTTRKFGGTGLGLAISRKIVEMMGGELKVSSEEGLGSVFTFSLRFQTASTKAANPDRTRRIGERVLVVSSCETVSDYLKKAVDYLGAGCDAVSGWSEAENMDRYESIFVSESVLRSQEEGPRSGSIRSKIIVLSEDWSSEKAVRSGEFSQLKWLSRPYPIEKVLSLMGQCRLSKSADSVKKPLALKQFAGSSVLLVDDNEINLLVAEGLLGKHGIKPIKVISGEQAWERCRAERYDLIFMDCMMPGMDGYETTKTVRTDADSVNCETPIVALTANAMKGDREKCLEAGMSDYLSKPLRQDELENALDRWLGEKRKPDNEPDRSSELVDLTAFRKSFAVEDERALAALMSAFVESLNEDLGNLERAISEEGDLVKVQTLSASIKGAAASHGASRLNEIADQLEKACIGGKSARAIELFDEMKSLSRQTQQVLADIVA